MRRLTRWTDYPYGRKLRRLHTWNGWLVLALAVTGVALPAVFLRELLGEGRVWLKQLHIGLGLLSIVIFLLYLPLIRRHLKQLRQRPGQRANLGVVLLLLAGWIVSGLLLWRFRSLSPAWSNAALWVHDLFSWIGIPYAVYHSVSRSRWVKREKSRETAGARGRQRDGDGEDTLAGSPGQAAQAAGHAGPDTHNGRAGAEVEAVRPATGEAQSAPSYLETVMRESGKREIPVPRPSAYTRRTVLRWGIAGILLLLLGPRFVRWIGSESPPGIGNNGTNAGGLAEADPNRMVPAPQPLPASLAPAEGGAKGNFRIYTVTEMPVFTEQTWSLEVTGLVDKPFTLTWERLLQIQREAQVSDFHCVTGWSVYKGTWEGIRLSQLLDQAGIKSTARYVKFYSGDGIYTDSLTLEQAQMDDVLVAVLLDGKLLPQQLGGPVRLFVPKMYAYKSVKWLNKIELLAEDHIGYWEERGYDKDAWVKGLKPANMS